MQYLPKRKRNLMVSRVIIINGTGLLRMSVLSSLSIVVVDTTARKSVPSKRAGPSRTKTSLSGARRDETRRNGTKRRC